MQLFTAAQKPESATAAPRELEDFPSYCEAAAKLSALRREEDDLNARIILATRQMKGACRDKPLPPPGSDREVIEIRQQIETVKAGIVAGEHAVRSAAAEAATEISRSMKPQHDRLRARVVNALTELRDALELERCFRADLDRRGMLSSAVIAPATVVELAPAGKLESIIAGLKGGF